MHNKLFLVDTSAWIFALRKDSIPHVRNRIDLLLKDDLVITTGMIKLEIVSGAKSEKERKRLKGRFEALDSVETDDQLWESACELGFKLRRKGLTIPYTDILIAACALKAESIVLHADAHFDLMANHIKMEVESLVREVATPL